MRPWEDLLRFKNSKTITLKRIILFNWCHLCASLILLTHWIMVKLRSECLLCYCPPYYLTEMVNTQACKQSTYNDKQTNRIKPFFKIMKQKKMLCNFLIWRSRRQGIPTIIMFWFPFLGHIFYIFVLCLMLYSRTKILNIFLKVG